jgi:hypothetical protein
MVGVIGLVVAAIALVVYALYRWWTGGGGAITPTRVEIGNDPAVPAAVAPKRVGVRLTRKSDGNPIPAQDIVFTILPGDDGRITSSIEGATEVTETTDGLGEADVFLTGTDDGVDVLQITIDGHVEEVPYETTGQ